MDQTQRFQHPEKIRIPSREQQSARKRAKHKKNGCIIIYTVIICLSCLYLQTQIFSAILSDRKAFYMSIFTYFDVFMCLLSYYQTIRIKNKIPKLRKTPQIQFESQKFFDYTYSLTNKQCQFCNNYKFPRVSHCSTCGQCIYKLDHHCIWTQTCIGFANQKSFYLFCFYMCIGVFQFWYFTVRVIRQHTSPFFQIMEPGDIILWVFTGFSAFFVGIMIVALWISHTLMILTNFKTLDGMKTGKMCRTPFFSRQNDPNHLNLYDRGQIQNFKSIFGDNIFLWWIPLQRQIENQFIIQKMAPHPDKLSLMKHTSLYQLQQKYCKYMHELSSKVGSLFIGKKMRLNNNTFIVQQQ